MLGGHWRIDGNDLVGFIGGLVPPLGKEPRDRFVEIELAIVEEHQRGGTGDRLGHGVDADQRIHPHRRTGLEVEGARRMFEDDLAAPSDHRGHAHQLAVGHHPVHLLCDGVQALIRHSHRLRFGAWQLPGVGHRGANQRAYMEQNP